MPDKYVTTISSTTNDYYDNCRLYDAQQQTAKLNVPKKTKLFVDQTLRERENSVLMHRVFQHDLYLLRLNTARSFIGALNTSANPVSDDVQEPIKLSAQVRNNILRENSAFREVETHPHCRYSGWDQCFACSSACAIHRLESPLAT